MRALSTIAGRLRVGFGVTVALILTAGVLSVVSLQRAGARSDAIMSEMRQQQESVQQVGYRILQEVAAGMRYLNTASAGDGARYAALAEDADKLRRGTVKVGALTSTERQQLDALGTLQGNVEVGIGVAHAYRATGRGEAAAGVLEKNSAAMDEIDRLNREHPMVIEHIPEKKTA